MDATPRLQREFLCRGSCVPSLILFTSCRTKQHAKQTITSIAVRRWNLETRFVSCVPRLHAIHATALRVLYRLFMHRLSARDTPEASSSHCPSITRSIFQSQTTCAHSSTSSKQVYERGTFLCVCGLVSCEPPLTTGCFARARLSTRSIRCVSMPRTLLSCTYHGELCCAVLTSNDVRRVHRNVYDWIAGMRKAPHHTPSHRLLSMKLFLSRRWAPTVPYPSACLVVNALPCVPSHALIHLRPGNSNDRCLPNYTPAEVTPCISKVDVKQYCKANKIKAYVRDIQKVYHYL
jgi:hypothetical protein